jgi:hypothetical protein
MWQCVAYLGKSQDGGRLGRGDGAQVPHRCGHLHLYLDPAGQPLPGRRARPRVVVAPGHAIARFIVDLWLSRRRVAPGRARVLGVTPLPLELGGPLRRLVVVGARRGAPAGRRRPPRRTGQYSSARWRREARVYRFPTFHTYSVDTCGRRDISTSPPPPYGGVGVWCGDQVRGLQGVESEGSAD